MGRLFGAMVPGMDIKPLVEELRERVVEELDYTLEARRAARVRARRTRATPTSSSPTSSTAPSTSIVSEWMEGTPAVADHRRRDARSERDHAGQQLRALPVLPRPRGPGCCTPTRTPATTGSCPTGGSGVLDFGAVARLPDGLPPSIGRLLRVALDGRRGRRSRTGLRAEGFIKPRVTVDARVAARLPRRRSSSRPRSRDVPVRPAVDAGAVRAGSTTRAPENWSTGLKLNLPPEYLLVHRVWLGGVGVLCQLDAEVPMPGRAGALAPRVRAD